MKPRALWIGGVVLVAIGGGLAWLFRPEPPLPVFNPNGPPPVDLVALIPEDLRLNDPPLPEDKNAYYLLQPVLSSPPSLPAAEQALFDPTPRKALTPQERRRVLNALKGHRAYYNKIGRIFAAYKLQWPIDSTPLRWDRRAIMELRKVTRKMLKAQRLHLDEGEVSEAEALARQSLQIGLTMFLSGGTAYDTMLTRMQLSSGAAAVRSFAVHPTATESAMFRLLQEMPDDLPLDSVEVVVKADLLMNAQYLGECRAGELYSISAGREDRDLGPIYHRAALDRRETFNLLVQASREIVADIRAGLPPDEKPPTFDKISAGTPFSREPWLFRWLSTSGAPTPDYDFRRPSDRKVFWKDIQDVPNPLGYGFLNYTFNVMMAMDKSMWLDTLAAYQMTRLLCALRIHRMRHGEYPAKLDELVSSKVLAKIPIDPWSGAPLRYDRKAKKLWTINENMVDDGGKTGQGWTGPDFAYELP